MDVWEVRGEQRELGCAERIGKKRKPTDSVGNLKALRGK